ncbi:disulfide bond formation protein B [Erwinia sp. OLTSP20]|uniref:disulfide bond formation protein B n=1 Tax=unclassified Erwinia TaxID=2622719 RepID=UPI000C180D27|nr:MULTISPECIES: disulfide bond formation protein B [unclassified Erwinia]PIJ50664.1 disulfide bond formation protein B [Erwinia sp. OAMSP11]PIJ72708.1 disulfide bond formation protein B [Erwinia sp. OLSSP12]PIJ83209.1 disulfide bond formation protein B [Erwinia sp. OLCASP19]PIJ85289.1 disulfide bond formation protein B [Erwinia sp. OLMTSP26]PIJ87291.1 disulfide bond formation protein B [Erwinia sp. OLMDSP33]
MKFALNTTNTYRMGIWLNTLGLFGINAILLIAFYYQLALSELPCPLCLLQRAGMMLIGFGFLFNICLGIKNIHYSIALFGCVLTEIIAVRQVFLHILPEDLGYGSTFLGLHFYTWALVASILITVAVAVIMTLHKSDSAQSLVPKSLIVKIVIALFILLITANLISTILECGGGQCADDPTFYQLLKP